MTLFASDYGYETNAQACTICGKLPYPCACPDAIAAYERDLVKREAASERFARACARWNTLPA